LAFPDRGAGEEVHQATASRSLGQVKGRQMRRMTTQPRQQHRPELHLRNPLALVVSQKDMQPVQPPRRHHRQPADGVEEEEACGAADIAAEKEVDET